MDEHVVILIEHWALWLSVLVQNRALRVAKLQHEELLDKLAMSQLVMSLAWVLFVRQDPTQVLGSNLLQITIHLLLLVIAVLLRRVESVFGFFVQRLSQDMIVEVPRRDLFEKAVVLIVHSFHL